MLNRGTVHSNWTKNIFYISIGSAIRKYYREFRSTLRNPTFTSSRMPLWWAWEPVGKNDKLWDSGRR